MKRKLLAWILLCTMLVSVFPLTVFAAEPLCPGTGEDHRKDTNCTSYSEIQTVPSVCGKQGHILYECNVCKERFATPLKPIGEDDHIFETIEEEVPATCTEPGKKKVEECTICHTKRGGEEIKALGHDMVEIDRTGSCLEAGVITTQCSRCPDVIVETPIDSTGTGHTWSKTPTSIKVEPTWDKNGVAVYTCEVCIATKEVKILALGHEHDMTHHEKVAEKCGVAGTVEYWSCSICEKNFKDEPGTTEYTDAELVIPAREHNLDLENGATLIDEKKSTCTEAGYIIIKCGHADCGAEITTNYELLNHTYKPEPTYDQAATCTTWGYTVEVCTACGDKKEIQTETPLGHTLWNDKSNTDAVEDPMTCEKDGTRTWNCGRCGEAQSETVEKTGHTVVTFTVLASCITYEYTFTYCSNEHCSKALAGTYTDEAGNEYNIKVDNKEVHFLEFVSVGTTFDPNHHHSFVEEFVINAPTCTRDGSAIGFCKACHIRDITVVLPATGHNIENVTWTVETPATCEAAGYRYKLCSVCDEKAVEETPAATGHDWEAGTPVAPTCQADGYTLYTCANDPTHTKNDDIVKFQEPAAPKDWYETYEAAKAAHPGLAAEDAGTVLRKGHCTLVGLTIYICSECERNVLVRFGETTGDGKHVDPGTYSGANEKAAMAPTCTEAGWTAAYTCSRCETFIESTPIEALGHDVVTDEAKDPTCTETGLTEGSHCTRCGVLVAQEEIPALGHDWTEATCEAPKTCDRCDLTESKALGHDYRIIDERTGNCELYGYKHYGCVNCQDKTTKEYALEYIDSYVAAIGHDYVLNEELSTPATCTETGIDMYICGNCQDEDPRETAALGHINEAEETIKESCTDTTEDRYCVRCKTEIEKPHSAEKTVDVAATCKEYGYTLKYCLDCGWSEISNVDGTYLADHTWGDWIVTTPPTQTEKGEETSTCSVCDDTRTQEIPALAGIKYTLSVDNATVAGSDITDSSLIAVTVAISGSDVAVQGLKFNLNYDPNVLKFEKYEFVSANFTTLTSAHDNGGYVSVLAWTPNNESGKTTDHVVTTTAEAVVVLYFRVDYVDAQTMTVDPYTTALSLDGFDTINTDGKVAAEGDTADITIVKFLDVNKDGDVTLVDLQTAIMMVTGEVEFDYKSSIDTDKNGVVDFVDIQNLCNYIIGAATYEELEALGVIA